MVAGGAEGAEKDGKAEQSAKDYPEGPCFINKSKDNHDS